MVEHNCEQELSTQLDAEQIDAGIETSGEDDNRGIVYILTHDYMPDIVKIGRTKNLKDRMSQLSNTSVPVPFKCYYAANVEDYKSVEKSLHNIFSDRGAGKEFFEVEPNRAAMVLQLVNGTDVTPDVTPEDDSDEDPTPPTRSENFSFGSVGIPVGSTLHLAIGDTDIRCEVADSGTGVLLNGEQLSLTAAAEQARQPKSASPAIKYWMYEGSTLYELKHKMLENQ